jgi:hypothetical protein
MPLNCDPAAAVAAAKCWDLDPSLRDQVELYLLAVIAGLPTDKAGVAAAVQASKCWNIDKSLVEPVKLFLTCQAAAAAGA